MWTSNLYQFCKQINWVSTKISWYLQHLITNHSVWLDCSFLPGQCQSLLSGSRLRTTRTRTSLVCPYWWFCSGLGSLCHSAYSMPCGVCAAPPRTPSEYSASRVCGHASRNCAMKWKRTQARVKVRYDLHSFILI